MYIFLSIVFIDVTKQKLREYTVHHFHIPFINFLWLIKKQDSDWRTDCKYLCWCAFFG